MKIINLFLIFLLIPLTLGITCDNNCTTPSCGAYEDLNYNSLCDNSESIPSTSQVVKLSVPVVVNETLDLITGQDLKTKTVKEVAEIYEIDSKIYRNELSNYYKTKIDEEDNFQFLHDNVGLEPSIAKDIALSIKNQEPVVEKVKNEKKYNFLLFTLISILGYLTTFFLSKKNIISIQNHRKIWNLFLLISFLISGILGLLLVIRINYGIVFNFPFNMLNYHVEAGIFLVWISIFHTLWHWSYIKNILKFN